MNYRHSFVCVCVCDLVFHQKSMLYKLNKQIDKESALKMSCKMLRARE